MPQHDLIPQTMLQLRELPQPEPVVFTKRDRLSLCAAKGGVEQKWCINAYKRPAPLHETLLRRLSPAGSCPVANGCQHAALSRSSRRGMRVSKRSETSTRATLVLETVELDVQVGTGLWGFLLPVSARSASCGPTHVGRLVRRPDLLLVLFISLYPGLHLTYRLDVVLIPNIVSATAEGKQGSRNLPVGVAKVDHGEERDEEVGGKLEDLDCTSVLVHSCRGTHG
jgi:hypothetical protein